MNKQNICAFILTRIMGWKMIGHVVQEPKCIILGAPHTSMWDFVVSYLYYTSLGGKANIIVKSDVFKWPLKSVLLWAGAIPVNRGKGASFTRHLIEAVRNQEQVHLAMTPEGTRKATKKWKAGFHTLARALDIPVYYGYFDWGKKEIGIDKQVLITDDAKEDMKRIKQWYIDKGVVGKHPERFDPY
ncbi:MAG: acyltransferase [Bacteroidales bacterium]|nr:acyltransferase [Bacteroidales bacterium]